ncbi:hypothetical protein [uncultured Roseobacter sp.]|uniref:hypothetical protein n=1 Tax=uncultured Roseobacter sp. TaxID=114847 RepID=UPI00260F8E60|nr:hypothetical protein [uncultured Roseobacter sp.]
MLVRMSGALMRGLLVALLIATPAILLPEVTSDQSQLVVLAALLAAFLTFAEYNSPSPSIVEFRDAAPFNRLRFVTVFLTVFLLTAIARGGSDLNSMSQGIAAIGTIVGNAIDFPFSPVRLIVLMLPHDASAEMIDEVRSAAGISYLISLIAMVAFGALVRLWNWPVRNGAFNVWVNLPLFDPTTGGDVLYRLQRDARFNIALGFLLPFVIPAVVKAASDLIDPVSLENPQTLIWTITAWAFLPASMIMRGIAMSRIAGMIEEKRRRAHQTAAKDAEYQAAW